jgi:uncharacterized protein (DUF983 family)
MGDYFIWILVALLFVNSLTKLIRDLRNGKRRVCPSCNSTNVSANYFRKYGVCRDCGQKWELPKAGDGSYGGGFGPH